MLCQFGFCPLMFFSNRNGQRSVSEAMLQGLLGYIAANRMPLLL
jgi:hypothetical protein